MGEGADGHELFVSTQEASGMVAHRYRRSLVLHLRHILPSRTHMPLSSVEKSILNRGYSYRGGDVCNVVQKI